MPDGLDAVKSRYAYGSWAGRNRLERDLHVQNLFVPRQRLDSLQLATSRSLPAGRQAFSSVWRGPGASLLRLDVVEAPSRAAAHEAVLAALDNLQSPLVTQGAVGIGDVAFTAPGDRMILFARANIVVLLASVGELPVDVTRTAEALDDWIAAERPDPAISSPAAATAAPRVEVRPSTTATRRLVVDVPAELATSGPPMVKLYADRGTVYTTRTGLRVRALGQRKPDVTAYIYERTPSGVGRWVRGTS